MQSAVFFAPFLPTTSQHPLFHRLLHLSAPVHEPMQTGKFEPTWESLEQYRTPDWYRDAKFGIWAHWGPQCQPEAGDWYARNMYIEGQAQNKSHVQKYGPPSEFGFKDVIHQWKAENFDPEKLMALYKRAGAIFRRLGESSRQLR